MYIQHLFVEYRHACWCSHLLSQFHQFSSGTARKLSGQLCRLKRKAVMILKRLKVRGGFNGWIDIVSYWYQAEKEALLYECRVHEAFL